MAALQVNATLGSINPKTNLPNGVEINREVSSATLAATAATDAATLAAAVVVFEGNKDDLATEATSLDTHNTAATGHAASVEAAVAVLEADGIAPTQAHVNALRVVWDLLAADLVLIDGDNDDIAATNTLVGTDYTDIAAASVALTADTAAGSASAGGDVSVSFDTTTVTTLSKLKVALLQVVASASSSLPP